MGTTPLQCLNTSEFAIGTNDPFSKENAIYFFSMNDGDPFGWSVLPTKSPVKNLLRVNDNNVIASCENALLYGNGSRLDRLPINMYNTISTVALNGYKILCMDERGYVYENNLSKELQTSVYQVSDIPVKAIWEPGGISIIFISL